MTVDELIANVLNAIRNHFYADRGIREFKRDEHALTRAIVRYGYECNERGWQFDAEFIRRELLALLRSIREKGADIKYLPSYLDAAVTRSIGQRAEELSAQAKSVTFNARKILAGVTVATIVREPSAAEICAAVFTELGKKQKARQQAKRQIKQAESKQGALL